jgi:hypothetical protein
VNAPEGFSPGFVEVGMHGIVAKRRTAHFGWLYVYDSTRVEHSIPKTPELRYSVTFRTLRDVARTR